MAKKTEKKTRKGTFGAVRLPVAMGYVTPRSLALGLRLGMVLGLIFLVAYVAGTTIGPRSFVSGGALSSNHATFESECWRCHEPFRKATDAACSACHEKFGDPIGTYSASRHYLYRSIDPGRVETAVKQYGTAVPACEKCHLEHRGRDAAIIGIADENCADCHNRSGFGTNHPEFDFRAGPVPDDATLLFTHIRHVGFVLKQTGSSDLETACLVCHVPVEDGTSFRPISYDSHCAACHLKDGVQTPLLPLVDAADPSIVGVESPAMMVSRGGAVAALASQFRSVEFEFIPARNSIRKLRIVHRDPWILENMRRLRGTVFETTVLGDLLDTDGIASNENVKDLGREAVSNLRASLAPLRRRPEPEVRRATDTMDSLLTLVEKRLALPGPAGLSVDLFQRREKSVSGIVKGAVNDRIGDLTGECRKCHLLSHAAIARVQKDQRSLTRAHFDHRAHILDLACLDCHREIPFRGDSTMTAGLMPEQELIQFPSSIQNLPGIDSCRECHGSRKVADGCVTCHFYHPDKSNRSNLLLTVQEE